MVWRQEEAGELRRAVFGQEDLEAFTTCDVLGSGVCPTAGL